MRIASGQKVEILPKQGRLASSQQKGYDVALGSVAEGRSVAKGTGHRYAEQKIVVENWMCDSAKPHGCVQGRHGRGKMKALRRPEYRPGCRLGSDDRDYRSRQRRNPPRGSLAARRCGPAKWDSSRRMKGLRSSFRSPDRRYLG